MPQITHVPAGTGAAGPTPRAPVGGFRLMRYFTATTLIAFAAVAGTLYSLQRREETFFERVQREQGAFLVQAQAQLARQNEAAARDGLLSVHEAGHVNLARLMANMLWAMDFAPFVASAQQVAINTCRALSASGSVGAAPGVDARRACFGETGRRIMALPGFKALDAKAYVAMQASTVFKIKVFDLRGITVYSSEHRQIGEDGAANPGWQSAAAGRPASELTHRDKFSAFERVVENRDLISTYVPVRAADGDVVVGVFEIYSDATPFLGQIKGASQRFADITAANEVSVAQTARKNQDMVKASSDRFLVIVGGLLVLLYGTSLLIVHHGQRIIDAQSRAQAQSAQREQLWHREKMAALATMAANVSHEVGNPLAVISGVAQELNDHATQSETVVEASQRILEQTARIAAMTRQIADFATARSEAPEWVDVNAMVKAVCDFLGFDRRFRGIPIEFQPGQRIPARLVIPDHLNEVLMDLLQTCAQSAPERGPGVRIRVQTEDRDDFVVIRVVCDGAVANAPAAAAGEFPAQRLVSVRRRLAEMGAGLSATATTVEITLPPARDESGAV